MHCMQGIRVIIFKKQELSLTKTHRLLAVLSPLTQQTVLLKQVVFTNINSFDKKKPNQSYVLLTLPYIWKSKCPKSFLKMNFYVTYL